MTFFWPVAASVGVIYFLWQRYYKNSGRANQAIQSYLSHFVYSSIGTFLYFPLVILLAGCVRETTAILDHPNFLLKIAIIMVFNEFVIYAVHWAGHNIEYFWCQHVVHHSSREFSFHTVFRQAPGLVIWAVPVFSNFFVFDLHAAAFCSAIMAIHSLWTHMDTRWEFNGISRFIHTPGTHRVHHELRGRAQAKNLGAIFTVFDHLFGTYEAPKSLEERAKVKYGAKGYSGEELIFPLLWKPYLSYFRRKTAR